MSLGEPSLRVFERTYHRISLHILLDLKPTSSNYLTRLISKGTQEGAP